MDGPRPVFRQAITGRPATVAMLRRMVHPYRDSPPTASAKQSPLIRIEAARRDHGRS